MAKCAEPSSVPGDSVVAVVTPHPPHERPVLLPQRVVAMAPAPLRDSRQRACQALARRLALDDGCALAGHPPVVREAEKVEGPGIVAIIVVPLRRISHQTGLLRVEREPVLREALRQ